MPTVKSPPQQKSERGTTDHRDELIATRESSRAANEAEIDKLLVELERAVAEWRKICEPQMRIEQLKARLNHLQMQRSRDDVAVECQIVNAAPAILKQALQRVQAEDDHVCNGRHSLGYSAMEARVRQLRAAREKLTALYQVPGDIAPAVRSIMADLAMEACDL